jgi:hypothetical protein
MRLKEVVMQLFHTSDAPRLEQLAATEPGAMRYFLGRLWDPDDEVRLLAAKAVASSASAHPDLGRDVIRRLMWALNDEAATNGVYGLAALGEIGARSPILITDFVGPIASYAWDDGLRSEILRALIRIASVAPELVAPHLDAVSRSVQTNETEERELITELWSLAGDNHDQA